MQKILLTCFLVPIAIGTCLIGSSMELRKVAQSPETDLPYRSFGLHRGGDARPDTYLIHSSEFLRHNEAIIGKNMESSPAREMVIDTLGASSAVIYGELINPDSLGPLRLVFSHFLKGFGQSLPDSSIEIQTSPGTFFDGVLDPRVRKFKVNLPPFSRQAYFSLFLGDRPVIEEFMVTPYDSVMIGLDLQRFNTVFSGPQSNFMETQYLIKREIQQATFASPRIVVQSNREKFLDREDYRAQWEEASAEFGPKLRILQYGTEAIGDDLAKLNLVESHIPGMKVLEEQKAKLNNYQFELLRQDILGAYYGQILSSLRRYGWLVAKAKSDLPAQELIDRELPPILETIKSQMDQLASQYPTSGSLVFYQEWTKMESSRSGVAFEVLAARSFPGLIRDQLLYAYAMEQVSRTPNPEQFLKELIAQIEQPELVQSLRLIADRLAPGQSLRYAEFLSADGQKIHSFELVGKPTLLYFYFSTCTHSANFFNRVLAPLYHAGLENTDLQLVAVSVDNDPKLWMDQMETYSDPSLQNLRLPSKQWREWLDHYLISAYPRTMLLNEQGKVISVWVPGTTESSFKNHLSDLLKSDANPSPIQKSKSE